MDRLLFVDFQTGNWCEAPIPPKTLLPNYKVVSPVFPATRGETFQFTLRVFNIPSDPSSWAKQPLHLALRAKQKGRPNSNLLLYTNRQYSGSISVNEDADTGTWYFDLPASIVVSSQGINDLLKVSGPSGASVMEVPLDFEIRIYSDSASGEIDRLITSPSTLHVYNDLKRDNDSPDAPAMQGYPEPDLIFTKDQAETWLDEYFRTHPIGVKSIGGETGDILLGTNLSMSGKTINATGGAVESVNGQTGKIILGLSLGQAGVAGQLSIAPNSNSGIELRGSKYVNSTTIEFTRVNNTTDNFILGTNLSLSGSTINSTGVSSIGGKTGIISLGNHLTISSGGLLNTNFGPLEYFEEYQSGATYGIRLKGSIGSSATDITYGTDEFSIGLRYLNSNVTIYPKTNESAERYLAFYPDTSVDHEIRFQDVALYSELPNFTVTALGGQKGDILLGTNLSMAGNTLNAAGGEVPSNIITTDNIAQNAVTSFNGSKGAVTYTAPVTSVNGRTGAVTVTEFPANGITQANIGTFAVTAFGGAKGNILTGTNISVTGQTVNVASPDLSNYATLNGNNNFTGTNTFNSKLIANADIENNTGVYFTPSSTNVLIGAVTPTADGVGHSWFGIRNITSPAYQIIYSEGIPETGSVNYNQLRLGLGQNVIVSGSYLDLNNKQIKALANGTAPTDAVNLSQLPTVPDNIVTQSNIATYAVTSFGTKKGDIIVGENLVMQGQTINATGGSGVAGVSSIGGMDGDILLSSDFIATSADKTLSLSSKIAKLNVNNVFTGVNTFNNYATFNFRALFNSGIRNNDGIYYTPSGTPVQIGSVTSVADGTLHSWAFISNLDSSISYSSRYFDSTGIERPTHVYLGDTNTISVRLRAGGFSADNKKITDVAPATLPTDAPNFSQLPDMSQYASLTGSNIFTGANTFSNSTTFNSQASFNAGMQNATGIYFSPTGVNVQMGNVVTTADGASHSWTMFYNGTNNLQAQVIGRGIGATGEVKDNDLYLGRTERVVIAGSTLMANGKKITNIAPATSPDEVPQFQQLPTNPITQANIATYAVTSLGDTKGDIALGTNLSMSGQTLNASGGEVPTNIITTDNIAQNAVTSFNGNKGAVTYTAPVTSVNGRTGAVTVTEFPANGITQANIGSYAVTSFGTQKGDILTGTNLTMSGKTVNASFTLPVNVVTTDTDQVITAEKTFDARVDFNGTAAFNDSQFAGVAYFTSGIVNLSGQFAVPSGTEVQIGATDIAGESGVRHYLSFANPSTGTTSVLGAKYKADQDPSVRNNTLFLGNAGYDVQISGAGLNLDNKNIRLVKAGTGTTDAPNMSQLPTVPSGIVTTGNISQYAVTQIGTAKGAIVLGTNLSMSGNTLNATGGSVPSNIVTTDNIKNYAVTSVDEHKGDLLMSGAFSWMEDPGAPDLWYGQLVLPENALTIENASSHVVTRINSATGDFTLGTNLSLSGHTINAASGGLRYFQEVLYPSSGGNVAMIQMKPDTDATDAAFGSYVAGLKFSVGFTSTISEPAVNVVPWSMEEQPGNKKLVLYGRETIDIGGDRIVEDVITTNNMPSNVITTGNIANNAVTAINNVNGAFTTGTGLSSSGRVIRTNLINYPESFSISDSYNGSDTLFYVTQGQSAMVNLGNSRTAVTGWMKYIDFRTGDANKIRLYVGNSENNSGYGGFRVDLQGTGSETAINSDGFKYNGKQVLT